MTTKSKWSQPDSAPMGPMEPASASMVDECFHCGIFALIHKRINLGVQESADEVVRGCIEAIGDVIASQPSPERESLTVHAALMFVSAINSLKAREWKGEDKNAGPATKDA